jgi:glutamyl-tRNA reductase
VSLISVGVDHEHNTLDFLERATVPEAQWGKVLRDLVSRANVHEAVFLSTCLRTEVVAVIDRFHGAIEEITEVLAEATGLAAEDFTDRLTVHFDRGVATHLFSVAAGLHSVVPGEHEVLGQVRRALELALEEGTATSELDELFHRAVASGRRVRAETAISRGTTSFARAAVETALAELGGLEGATVVVAGAGQLATGVVRGLLDAGPARVVLLNRTPERAEALARELGDARLEVGPLESLAERAGSARLLVTALEAPATLLRLEDLATRRDPLLVVDLAMPRAVDPAVEQVEGVTRVDISHLGAAIERALDDRRGALEEAGAIVADEVERFTSDQRARGAAAIVRDLRAHFDDVVAAELERRQHDLDGLSDEERDRVRSLVRSVVAKIAHRPTVALKEAAGTDRGVRLTEATRQLFDI